MRLEGRCKTCGRQFVLAMLAPLGGSGGGRCPFCGVRITDAPAALAQTVHAAEEASRSLIGAIRVLNGMDSGFRLSMELEPADGSARVARHEPP